MTTAHRATWHPAIASARQNVRSSYSVKEMASHTKIKYRQRGQGNATELANRDLKKELEDRERAHKEEQERLRIRAGGLPSITHSSGESSSVNTKQSDEHKNVDDIDDIDDDFDERKVNLIDDSRKNAKDAEDYDHNGVGDFDDSDLSFSEAEDFRKKSRKNNNNDDDDDDDDDDDSSDGDDSEDSEDELRRVLEQVKKEHAEKARRKQEVEAASASHQEALNALASNPLLADKLGPSNDDANDLLPTKRRWDDDVVFRNQAREVKDQKKRFTNDVIRSDFHRNFLNKYFK